MTFKSKCKTPNGSPSNPCAFETTDPAEHTTHWTGVHGRRASGMPRMYGRNGAGMWRTPTRKSFTPDGLCVGAEVIVRTEIGRVSGQVWSEGTREINGKGRRYVRGTGYVPTTRRERGWWIAGQGAYWFATADEITVTGQCTDAALFSVAVAL